MKIDTNLLIVAALAIGGWYAFKKLDEAANINRGTAFEGAGAVGTLGNVTDQISGGFFSRVGRGLGDLLDPVNRKTLDELTGTDTAKVTASENAGVGFGGVF